MKSSILESVFAAHFVIPMGSGDVMCDRAQQVHNSIVLLQIDLGEFMMRAQPRHHDASDGQG